MQWICLQSHELTPTAKKTSTQNDFIFFTLLIKKIEGTSSEIKSEMLTSIFDPQFLPFK